MSSPIQGGCHCGAVRYTVPHLNAFAFRCHCDSCRRLSSGARLTAISVQMADLKLTGELTRYTYDGGKAPIHMDFCGTCGTQMYALPTAYDGIAALRIGTLDDDNALAEVKPIYAHQACGWDA